MKGFVPTPEAIVDLMVAKLFAGRRPSRKSRVLDPGCGRGAFVQGVVRWCRAHGRELPQIVGIDSDPSHTAHCRQMFADIPQVEILENDFLRYDAHSFDYIVGNPPYVSLAALSLDERAQYRSTYETAKGRFDLYLLFFEKAMRLLGPTGRLVFITPEKYLYVETARPLRRLLAEWEIEELHFLTEDSFPGLVTYPLVTTVCATKDGSDVRVIERGGARVSVQLPDGDLSWIPAIRGARGSPGMVRLEDIALRVSCGVATGADSVFMVRAGALDPALESFAHPTISGREITSTRLPQSRWSLLVPYTKHGQLLPEAQLGALLAYLSHPDRKAMLERRYCVASKPWYAFHETPPLTHILRPKILCKDIGSTPLFVVDPHGTIVPRHSTYYIVPAHSSHLEELATYLNSTEARTWLRNHCQHAANGFVRVQSHVLKRLPLPPSLAQLAPLLPLDAESTLVREDNSVR